MQNNEWIGLLGVLAIVAGGIFMFSRSRGRKDNGDTKPQREISYPLWLQAHERMVLFLERIKPQSLLTRIANRPQSVEELKQVILHEIRTELEHNAAQQLYIKQDAWEKINLAAQTTAADLINSINENNRDAETRVVLVNLLKKEHENINFTISDALKALKDEVQKNF